MKELRFMKFDVQRWNKNENGEWCEIDNPNYRKLFVECGLYADNEDTLSVLKKQVGGWIEHVFVGDKFSEMKIDVWVNEEGKLIDGVEYSGLIMCKQGLVDTLFGNIVFTGFNDDGETINLTNEQIKFIKENVEFCDINVLGIRIKGLRFNI